jgi:hypothetical protein
MKFETTRNVVISLFICTLFLVACSGVGRLYVNSEDKFVNPYVSFNAPASGWYSLYSKRSGGKKNAKGWGLEKEGKAQSTNIYNQMIKNNSLRIEVNTWPFYYMPIDILFDKDGDHESRNKYLSNTPQTLKQNKEQNITYDKDETQYFQGMKCMGNVFSRGDSHYSKNYSLTCAYYHLSQGKRLLRINYTYFGDGNGMILDKDTGKKIKSIPQASAEEILKKGVDELLTTVKLKNVDWERMKKEGLLHDKPFKTISW